MKDLFLTIVVGIIGMIVGIFALVLGTFAAAILLVLDLFFKALPYVVAGLILLTIWHFFVNPLI
jgi:predicted benzoate:H+ symporter BenE